MMVEAGADAVELLNVYAVLGRPEGGPAADVEAAYPGIIREGEVGHHRVR